MNNNARVLAYKCCAVAIAASILATLAAMAGLWLLWAVNVAILFVSSGLTLVNLWKR